jgi:hypothetical protein
VVKSVLLTQFLNDPLCKSRVGMGLNSLHVACEGALKQDLRQIRAVVNFAHFTCLVIGYPKDFHVSALEHNSIAAVQSTFMSGI